jgi:hypothetical protein
LGMKKALLEQELKPFLLLTQPTIYQQ